MTALYLRQPAVAWYQISLDMRPKIKDMLFAANKAVVLTVALVSLQASLSSFPAVCWLYRVGFISSSSADHFRTKQGVSNVLYVCLQTILYSFPAVCWLYGAGFMFSSFASLVFWGQPIARLWELLRAQLTVVQPVGLQVRPSLYLPLCISLSLCAYRLSSCPSVCPLGSNLCCQAVWSSSRSSLALYADLYQLQPSHDRSSLDTVTAALDWEPHVPAVQP